MNTMRQLSRRDMVKALGMTGIGGLVAAPSLRLAVAAEDNAAKAAPELRRLAQFVHVDRNWTEEELDAFLWELPKSGLLSTKIALGTLSEDADESQLTRTDVSEIKKQFLWVSTNILTWPFRSAESIDYHEWVKWLAQKSGVSKWVYRSQPTFVVERAIIQQLFKDTWDNLSEEDRGKVLKAIDPGSTFTKEVALASTGSVALATLCAAVKLGGFGFYMGMSSAMCSAAGAFGITLPFSAFVGASSLVAFLTGPVGWTLAAIGAATALYLKGQPNIQKMTAAVVQIHSLKVAALMAAEKKCPEFPRLAAPRLYSPDPDEKVVSGTDVKFWWYKTPGATEYELYARGVDDKVYREWVRSTDRATLGEWSKSGTIKWWVRAWNNDCGYSAWSDEGRFIVEADQ